MKKVILFVAVISAFSFASCKKDRTCTCVETGGATTVTTITKATKANASAACLSYSTVSGNNTTVVTCTLK